jgi:hypothetical protein
MFPFWIHYKLVAFSQLHMYVSILDTLQVGCILYPAIGDRSTPRARDVKMYSNLGLFTHTHDMVLDSYRCRFPIAANATSTVLHFNLIVSLCEVRRLHGLSDADRVTLLAKVESCIAAKLRAAWSDYVAWHEVSVVLRTVSLCSWCDARGQCMRLRCARDRSITPWYSTKKKYILV